MGGQLGRSGEPPDCLLFPESTPPDINYVVLTGTLTGEPRQGRSPAGDLVTLLGVEFPVAHPEHPRLLLTCASYEVEVPGAVGGGEARELRGGTAVLVSGLLSERWAMEDGRTSRRGVIVANLIHPGPPPEQQGDLFVAGGRP